MSNRRAELFIRCGSTGCEFFGASGVALWALVVDQVLRCGQLAGCWRLYSWESYSEKGVIQKRIRIYIHRSLLFFGVSPAMASGQRGGRLEACSAYEIERRPRGASRPRSLLHLFGASLSCGANRDRLVGMAMHLGAR
ncbi:hypothetical protein ACIPW4_04980 [Pseudomonas sp. NPDC089996]|uniref:hypothetical protein n=1 Tax=Pseudomonas sp. NPDC089996 TaxID=3364474 RepID=UPI00381C9031